MKCRYCQYHKLYFCRLAQWRIFCTMQNYLHWARWRLFCTVRWRLGEDNLVGVTQPLLTSAIGWPQITQYHNFTTNTISQKSQYHDIAIPWFTRTTIPHYTIPQHYNNPTPKDNNIMIQHYDFTTIKWYHSTTITLILNMQSAIGCPQIPQRDTLMICKGAAWWFPDDMHTQMQRIHNWKSTWGRSEILTLTIEEFHCHSASRRMCGKYLQCRRLTAAAWRGWQALSSVPIPCTT